MIDDTKNILMVKFKTLEVNLNDYYESERLNYVSEYNKNKDESEEIKKEKHIVESNIIRVIDISVFACVARNSFHDGLVYTSPPLY